MNIKQSLYYNPDNLNNFRKKRPVEISHGQTLRGDRERTEYIALHENKTGVCLDNKSVNRSKATAGENPSGRLSFKANPSSYAMKLAKSNHFNWFLDVTQKNSLVADGIFALGLTAGLRPLMMMLLPTKTNDKYNDKRKNQYQMIHSIATGIMGLGTTMAVAVPVKKVVNKFINYAKTNPEVKASVKYIFQSPKTEMFFRETASRIHQPLFLPIRAGLTIAIIPPLLGLFGLSKPTKNESPNTMMYNEYSILNFKKKGNKTFQNFAGLMGDNTNDNSQITQTSANKSNPSFKGTPMDLAVKGIHKIAKTGVMESMVNWLAKCKNGFPHLIALESLWLSLFYMEETARSKKIEKDQKLPMEINQGIVAGACTAGAYTIDGKINKKITNFKNIYKEAFKEMKAAKKAELRETFKFAFKDVEKASFAQKRNFVKNFINANTANRVLAPNQLAKRLDGISFMKSTIIFATIYRFVGPVVLTPFANFVSNYWVSQKK